MNPRTLLANHSREIETTCCELRGRTYADDPRQLVDAYRRFERAMLDHLEAEEQLLLPTYAVHAPDDARRIAEEHAELRVLLYRLAIDVELHTVRAPAVDRLVTRLREHAAHEDEGLYTWAAAHLAPEPLSQLLERIHSSSAGLAVMRDVVERPTMQS